MTTEEITSRIRDIKQRFWMMRNGAIGQQMRSAGINYKVNFGLNLPQVQAIAADFPKDTELAEALWANTSTRESMLIAPMLMPVEVMTAQKAREWAASVSTVEVADVLAHRLLRHLPDAEELALDLAEAEEPYTRYTGFRLMTLLLARDSALAGRFSAKAYAEAASDRPTAAIAAMLAADIDFIREEEL